jgi:predicted DNA-binding transcriptional regulator YafY
MRRAERLFRLVNEMRSHSVSRADDLAHHLEVSVRTVYRDIAHLQASGLPIEGEAGVGYLLRPGFDLPSVTFTYDQVDALAMGLSFVERTGDPALAAAAREARAKIQAGLPQPEARTLADAPFFTLRRADQPSHAGPLRKAIRKRLVTELTYQDGAGLSSARRVQPLAIWSLPDGWMFSGWCELRQDFRTFRFDRISSLRVTEDVFADDDRKNLQAFLALDHCEADDAPVRPVAKNDVGRTWAAGTI